MRDDQSASPPAIPGQHLVVVHGQALEPIGTTGQLELTAILVGGSLPDVVDGAGGVANAGEQAVGAPNQFNLLE